MSKYIEFVPQAGASLTTRNVVEGTGRVRWMVREEPQAPADNGWRIFSDIDTEEYLDDENSWVIVDFNELCAIEPALIGIWDQPFGADLQIVIDEQGIKILHTETGEELTRDEMFIPPQFRS